MAPRKERTPSDEEQMVASSRTTLELIAELMEASFERLGEGAILGTLPEYLEDFGARNVRYLQNRFISCDPRAGAVSALTGPNFLSRVTHTGFELPVARKDHAVKRLLECEFQKAFQGRSEFVRAMICLLHVSTTRGAVNGLLEDPQEGYDVELGSRILFGDDHCDFIVRSRPPRPVEADTECPIDPNIPKADVPALAHQFYTAILVALVEYLLTVLPEADVRRMATGCAGRVGTKVARVLGDAGKGQKAARDTMDRVLTYGGRRIVQDGNVSAVTACPFAEAILTTTRRHEPEEARKVHSAACLLCKAAVGAAVGATWQGADVARDTCLTLGDKDCRFRVVSAVASGGGDGG